jgi:uncharacterized protein (TIGR02452 family)
MENNWNGQQFAHDFTTASYSQKKQMLILVAKSNSEYFSHIPCSIKYSTCPQIQSLTKFGKVCLFNGTTDDAIYAFKKGGSVQTANGELLVPVGLKICALNFANAHHVGGGYLNGATAQEEELCRQYPLLYNSLNHMLKLKQYPIKPTELIYTENIPRHRTNKISGYEIVTEPTVFCDFITAAAPNFNNKSCSSVTSNDIVVINETIKRILNAPVDHGVSILILGAFGCGCFAPVDNVGPEYKYTRQMAKIFVEHIKKYKTNFGCIVFAIPPDANYYVFQEEFSLAGLL